MASTTEASFAEGEFEAIWQTYSSAPTDQEAARILVNAAIERARAAASAAVTRVNSRRVFVSWFAAVFLLIGVGFFTYNALGFRPLPPRQFSIDHAYFTEDARAGITAGVVFMLAGFFLYRRIKNGTVSGVAGRKGDSAETGTAPLHCPRCGGSPLHRAGDGSPEWLCGKPGCGTRFSTVIR